MAVIDLHRTKDRKHLALPIRVERLEEDADIADGRHDEVVAQLKTANARLMGILASLVVACLMLAANLTFK